jgi:hypothetical protein
MNLGCQKVKAPRSARQYLQRRMKLGQRLTCQIPRIIRGANKVSQCSYLNISSLIIGNNLSGKFSTLQSIYAIKVFPPIRRTRAHSFVVKANNSR